MMDSKSNLKENGIWIPLLINEEVEEIFCFKKIETVEEEGWVISYVIYQRNISPLDEYHQVQVIFKEPVHAMRMSTESSSWADDKLWYHYEGEGKRGWMGEVKESRYLKWFRKASFTTETTFYDHVQHYAMIAQEDMIEVITDGPPEFRIVKRFGKYNPQSNESVDDVGISGLRFLRESKF